MSVMPALLQSSFAHAVMTIDPVAQDMKQIHSWWTYRVYRIVHKAACVLLVARFPHVFTQNLTLVTDMVFAHQGAATETTEAHDSNNFYTRPQLLFINVCFSFCYCVSRPPVPQTAQQC